MVLCMCDSCSPSILVYRASLEYKQNSLGKTQMKIITGHVTHVYIRLIQIKSLLEKVFLSLLEPIELLERN